MEFEGGSNTSTNTLIKHVLYARLQMMSLSTQSKLLTNALSSPRIYMGLHITRMYGLVTKIERESLANAKVSARQQCLYEGP